MQAVRRRSIWRRRGCRGRDRPRRCNACASSLARRNWGGPRAWEARWRPGHCRGTGAWEGRPRSRRSWLGWRRSASWVLGRRGRGRRGGPVRRRICGRRGCGRRVCSGGRGRGDPRRWKWRRWRPGRWWGGWGNRGREILESLQGTWWWRLLLLLVNKVLCCLFNALGLVAVTYCQQKKERKREREKRKVREME